MRFAQCNFTDYSKNQPAPRALPLFRFPSLHNPTSSVGKAAKVIRGVYNCNEKGTRVLFIVAVFKFHSICQGFRHFVRYWLQ